MKLLLILLLFADSTFHSKSSRVESYQSIDLDTIHNVSILGRRYNVLDVKDSNDDSRQIIIVSNKNILAKLALPSVDDYMGFSVNWIKKTKLGFQLSLEYGSRIYYQKDFDFEIYNNDVYLTKVKVITFDKDTTKSEKVKIFKVHPKKLAKNISIKTYL